MSQLIAGSNELEVYKGKEAYFFLLRLTTGLESKVLGETDIFGQFKEAWSQAVGRDKTVYLCLNSWVQRIFEDTKEIRTQYLQNLGGSSYGSLVRKMIREQGAHVDQPILIVGAGQIARSIAPLLSDFELWLWNRDPIRLCAFHDEISMRSRSQVKKLGTEESEAKGWREAGTIVVCVPLNSARDLQRIQWFQQGKLAERLIIHLGGIKEQCELWKAIPQFRCLSDLFDLQNVQGNVRSVQITQAERACEDRAKLRALGVSLSIPHGWEDLASFG
jgi:hypothetical protein